MGSSVKHFMDAIQMTTKQVEKKVQWITEDIQQIGRTDLTIEEMRTKGAPLFTILRLYTRGTRYIDDLRNGYLTRYRFHKKELKHKSMQIRERKSKYL